MVVRGPPGRRRRRTREGARHTALAAKNHLEKRKGDSRGSLKFFYSGDWSRAVTNAPWQDFALHHYHLDRVSEPNIFPAGSGFPFSRNRKRIWKTVWSDDDAR